MLLIVIVLPDTVLGETKLPRLVRALDSMVALPFLRTCQVGVAVLDVGDDRMIYQHSSEQRFIPASNLKLVISACALVNLGPDFVFNTKFFMTGNINSQGELEGDLILQGSGDPSISGRDRSSNLEIFELWADSLKSRGVISVQGDLVLDERYFDDQRIPAGWNWDDLSYWYAAPTAALSYNDNCVDLYFSPGDKVGDPAKIRIVPQTTYISIDNQTQTSSPGSARSIDYYRSPGSNSVRFFGSVAVDDTAMYHDYVSVSDPGRFLASVFREVLSKKGIGLKGSVVDFAEKEIDIGSTNLLFEWHSSPLREILRVVNKNSQNFYAEQLLKTIGKEQKGEGSFAAGLAAESTFLTSAGINTTSFCLQDGSGLSYQSLLTPRAIVKLLAYMNRLPEFNDYFESLAIPGIDRTVKTRWSADLKSQMRVKTGNLKNVSTYSGYIRARNKKLYAFSILMNNCSVPFRQIWAWQDHICKEIFSWAK